LTLILTCMTNDYAFQVSDRRLIDMNGKIFDDDQNKAVLFSTFMTFGYTGLAYTGRKKGKIFETTDIWLTEVLSDPEHLSFKDAIEAVRDRATYLLRKIPLPILLSPL